MFDENLFFLKYTPQESLLIKYGFVFNDNKYVYKTDFCENKFLMIIIIDIFNKQISTSVIDKQSNDEYNLFKISNNIGTFNLKIKSEYEKILKDIKDKCFVKQNFINDITNEIAKYIYSNYHCNPEFIFEKYPNIAVFKNSFNGKWFGLILYVEKSKLTKNKNDKQKIEILNTKIDSNLINWLKEKYDYVFLAYHMNKKNWISVILNDKTDFNLLTFLIETSYNLTNQ